MVKTKEIESYLDLGRAIEISNGVITMTVTLDMGPRIMHFGFVGGQNVLCTENFLFLKPDKAYIEHYGEGRCWNNVGGHRIWFAPETYPETYYPDNYEVEYNITDNGALFIQHPETENGFSKTLEIKMDPDDANVQVIMNIGNISDAEKRYSVWGLSTCAKGGVAVFPMNDNDTGFLNNRIISVWPYTDLRDDRIYFGKKYSTITQSIGGESPIKIGFDINKGNSYYFLGEDIFLKSISPNHETGAYPDGGCSFEAYTNDIYLELETLSELKTVKPGGSITHTEHWSLCKKPCEVDFKDDSSIENVLSMI